jgi:hypothetical protein
VPARGEQHSHDPEVHDHEHAHVTHHLSGGQDWTHLTASHQHEHNHAAVTHSHEPHEDSAKEHRAAQVTEGVALGLASRSGMD